MTCMIRNFCRHPSSSSSGAGLAEITNSSGGSARRNQELKRVDRELSRGNEKGALKMVKRLQGKPDGLRGFGAAAKEVAPLKKQSLDVLYLNGVYLPSHPVNNSTVDSLVILVMKIIGLALEGKPVPEMISDKQVSLETRHLNCARHEAGHFLVAYLLGILPRRYLVPSISSMKDDIQAQSASFVELVDFTSPFEGDSSKDMFKSLNKFSCTALGGILATYPDDVDQGFHSDIFKVYSSVKWMGLTDAEIETYMRWVIQKTHHILERHRVAALRLANAMANEQSIGYCIAAIEDSLS